MEGGHVEDRKRERKGVKKEERKRRGEGEQW